MTDCLAQLIIPEILKTPVVIDFDGGNITSDAGAVLLRQLDNRLDVTSRFSSCMIDRRDSAKTRHTIMAQFRQRVYQICLGYEDANDADSLRSDPAFKIAVGRHPETDGDLASQPTITRFENAVTGREIKRLNRELVNLYLDHRKVPGARIILDFDSTDDPVHGQQTFSYYHGFYGQHMFHPLLCYDGDTGDLLSATLRPGNVHAANGVVGTIKRIVRKIRKRWPWVEIVIRADAGFCVPRLYKFCERHGIGYVIGLITNATLKKLHKPLLDRAVELYDSAQSKVRIFDETGYRAGKWNRFRRVIMKAEAMDQGTNRRFVVTNLEGDPQDVYDFYVQRGDVENRIKELKNALKADRLSCHRFDANRFRLLLHCAAYVLSHQLKKRLDGTELQNAQIDTIRLKLLKVGARIRQTVRRVWIHAASGYPYQHIWRSLLGDLSAAPT